VAAIERPGTRAAACGSLVAAALALPGASCAQPGPGPGLVSFKWLDYSDRQPGFDRVGVQSPSVLVAMPLGERWGVEASYTADSVSGASPRWHTSVSSASRFSDDRRGGDVKVTRYGDRAAVGVGLAASGENDFDSRAVSLQGTWNSDDNNRSWDAAVAYTYDRVGSVNDPALDEPRRTVAVTASVTQALSRADLVQLGLTYSRGRGYFSDPYKFIDIRPDSRDQAVLLLRWNHYFEGSDVTLRASWRGYRDTFGIRSQTVTLEPAFEVSERFAVVPALRLYTQSAADFYYDPVYSYIGAPFPPGWLEAPPQYLSPDQRLAAFGAVTLGIKLIARFGEGWSADLRVEGYEQRSSWRVGGDGSPGLEPLSATFIQIGLSKQF
jgi:hypothetical protein